MLVVLAGGPEFVVIPLQRDAILARMSAVVVCLCVCVSVCLSHAGIVSKRLHGSN